MYIQDVHIQNIRSIADFKMHFDNPAGWHVIIGDNGAGKTTVARAIALGLFVSELDDAKFLRESFDDWIGYKTKESSISFFRLFNVKMNVNHFRRAKKERKLIIKNGSGISRMIQGAYEWIDNDIKKIEKEWVVTVENSIEKTETFSCSFGSFRRFTGGNEEKEKLYKTHPKLGAHLSLFGEDVALSEAIPFLKYLYVRKLENKEPESLYLDLVVKFINKAELLPNKAKIKQVTYDDIFFIDGNGQEVTVLEMSDGFRSILSLTLELIRQLVRVYGLETVFEYVTKDENVIKTPGVVIIDEIDAHLHPTWQVRVGEWFLKYFPALQFIVTTHSPLICRASHTGTIWRLASPASDRPSGEVLGIDKDRLVYGNILDAYDTDVFGKDIEQSKEGRDKLKRLAQLNQKDIYSEQGLTAEEKQELTELKRTFPTDVAFDF